MLARGLLVRTIAAGLCATAAVAIVVLLSRHFDDTSGRILLTTSTISVAALLLVPAGMLLDRHARSLLGRASVLLTGLGFVLTLAAIWAIDHSTPFWKTWGIVATLAVAAAQGAGVEARRRDRDSPTVRLLVRLSAVTGALLAGLGVLAILTEIADSAYYRFVGAVAILDVLAVALTAVLRRGTGPATSVHRLRVDGRLVQARGRDFAAAAAAAIREAERTGARVQRVERVQ
jgi:hypothetical protein